MAQIEILSEEESGSGWRFDLQALEADGRLTRFEIRLSWADYNHWSPDGGDAPAAVAEAALRCLLEQPELRAVMPASFDAASLRRRLPDADELIRQRIDRPGLG